MYKTVIVIGQDLYPNVIEKIKGYSEVLILGDGKTPIDEIDLSVLKDTTNKETFFIVYSHDNIDKKESKKPFYKVNGISRNDLLNKIKAAVNDNIDQDIKVNVTNENNSSALLLFASIHGSVKLVELLIAEGADVNATDKEGDSALILAIKNGKTDIAKCLIKSSKVIPEIMERSLFKAIEIGNEEIIDMMIDGDLIGNDKIFPELINLAEKIKTRDAFRPMSTSKKATRIFEKIKHGAERIKHYKKHSIVMPKTNTMRPEVVAAIKQNTNQRN